MKEENIELEKLLNDFLTEFPIEKLKSMTLEEYTDTERNNSFCYWVETKLETCGSIWGGSAFKFGIFKQKNIKSNTDASGGITDGEYSWYKKYGETKDEAFKKVHSSLLDVVNFSMQNQFDKINNIDLGNAFKWKIAFLYSNKSFIPIFDNKWLVFLAAQIDSSVTNKTSQSELYKILMANQKDVDFWTYYEQLVEKYLSNNKEEIAMKNHKQQINEYINLLTANHNLIFHGAPGTGKTFTAKEMTAQMIFGKIINEDEMNEDQKKQWKEQFGFVQFHPSYDYTDFVEGLRPSDDNKQNVSGFKRVDGVFKEFCERAAKNFEDSKKTVEEIQTSKTIDEIIASFLDESIEKRKEFLTKTNSKFIIQDYNDKSIYIYNIVIDERLRIAKNDIIEISTVKNEILNNVTEVRDMLRPGQNRQQQDSYVFILCNEIINIKNNSSYLKVEKSETQIEKKNYIFLIDEINRGESSKIFGELFFSIDPGYRGKKGQIKTQYQNLVEGGEFKNGFYVPENVYIIGTMNDIDRSVETMDFAFRRRFAWKNVKAKDTQEEILKSLPENIKQRAIIKMDNINEVIRNNVKEMQYDLGEAYCIGGAYFKKIEEYLDNGNEEPFESLWKYHIEGLLTEYLRGQVEELDRVVKNIHDVIYILESLLPDDKLVDPKKRLK